MCELLARIYISVYILILGRRPFVCGRVVISKVLVKSNRVYCIINERAVGLAFAVFAGLIQ